MGNKQEGGGGLSKSNSKRLAASGHGETTTLPASRSSLLPLHSGLPLEIILIYY